jgi:TRAP-type C4-dicarboxylate transport system substrate-binding protein
MQTKAEEQVVADKLKSMGVNFYQFGEIAKMRELMKPVIDDKMTKDPAIKAFVEAVRKIEAGS